MLKKGYRYESGIYVYSFNDEIVQKIKEFYQDDPFPNYELNDDKSTIKKEETLIHMHMS